MWQVVCCRTCEERARSDGMGDGQVDLCDGEVATADRRADEDRGAVCRPNTKEN